MTYLKTLSMAAVMSGLLVSMMPAEAFAGVKPGYMNMSRKDVKGQIQITGHYGALWTEKEIRSEAETSCKQLGMRVALFQLGELTKRKGQAFVAVCK
jgi:hypothetical protein